MKFKFVVTQKVTEQRMEMTKRGSKQRARGAPHIPLRVEDVQSYEDNSVSWSLDKSS